MIRQAAVAGMFYPGGTKALRREVEDLLPTGEELVEGVGVWSLMPDTFTLAGSPEQSTPGYTLPRPVSLLAPTIADWGPGRLS